MTLSDVFRPFKPLGEYNMQELHGGHHYAWCPICNEPERLLLSYENGAIFSCGFMDKVRGHEKSVREGDYRFGYSRRRVVGGAQPRGVSMDPESNRLRRGMLWLRKHLLWG